MLDLKKYLRRASADPGFRAKLLKNANQAIKEEFGEELPYKLKCKEKIVFEVAPTDEISDADLSDVAGGTHICPTPMCCQQNDIGPRSANAYRQGYGFNSPPVYSRYNHPYLVRGGHSPFVRSRDDSEIRKVNFDGIGTAPIYNPRNYM